MPNELLSVSDESFEIEVLKADGTVLVLFYAMWCGPCLNVLRYIDVLGSDLKGRAKLVKLDVELCDVIPEDYKIFTIPTFLFFRAGAIIDSIVGAVPMSRVMDTLVRHETKQK